MDFLKPGQEVKLKKQFGNFNGIIKAVWIGESGAQYQVMYFNQGKIEEPYIVREMFDPVFEEPQTAGFRISPPKDRVIKEGFQPN